MLKYMLVESEGNMEKRYTDIGLYTYSDLTKLLGISRARIKGLVDGNKRKNTNIRVPVVEKKSFVFDNKEYFSFIDLIEIKFIQHFLNQGIKRKTIIDAYHKAKIELKKERPFATKFIANVSQNIFMDNDDILVNSKDNQIWFREISKPELFEGIDFKDDLPTRWMPYKDLPNVIIDPAYNYGMPILKDHNLKTLTIFDAYIAEKENIKRVSEWFGIEPEIAMQAVVYERRLAA